MMAETEWVTILPTAALVAAGSSVVVTILRERIVQSREDERVKAQVSWEYQRARMDALARLAKSVPTFAVEYDDAGTPDLPTSLESGNRFLLWLEGDAEPWLDKKSRDKILPDRQKAQTLFVKIFSEWPRGSEATEQQRKQLQEQCQQFLDSCSELRRDGMLAIKEALNGIHDRMRSL